MVFERRSKDAEVSPEVCHGVIRGALHCLHLRRPQQCPSPAPPITEGGDSDTLMLRLRVLGQGIGEIVLRQAVSGGRGLNQALGRLSALIPAQLLQGAPAANKVTRSGRQLGAPPHGMLTSMGTSPGGGGLRCQPALQVHTVVQVRAEYAGCQGQRRHPTTTPRIQQPLADLRCWLDRQPA